MIYLSTNVVYANTMSVKELT